jgi:hypothetical protein
MHHRGHTNCVSSLLKRHSPFFLRFLDLYPDPGAHIHLDSCHVICIHLTFTTHTTCKTIETYIMLTC